MPVDLRHLRAFVVVVEEGSISRAAPRLFITQPALSRQIQQLEEEVGQPVLARGPHGVEPTPVGVELLEKARAAIEATEAALRVGDGERPHGRLTLGLPFAGGRDRWFGLTQAFCEAYPAVEVEVRESFSGQLQRQVLAKELDATIALQPTRLPGLTYLHLFDDPVSVWVHHEHPLADREQLTPSDLHGQRITLLSGRAASDTGFNEAIKAIFEGTGGEPDFVPNTEIYPPRSGIHPGYMSLSVRLDSPDTVVRVPLEPERTMPFEFVHRIETSRSAVRAFAKFAAERLGDGHSPTT